jgi:ubiquinone biosynthesis protein
MIGGGHDRPGSPTALLRSAPRVGAVLDVLRRHGFGDLLTSGRSWPEPENVRAALEELGLVFVKLGQLLSTRSDLLPPSYIEALEALQDGVTRLDIDAVREVVQAEFGSAPEELFATFEEEPLAAASIAQVHAASLGDGTEVVVKVQRPGLGEQIEGDLLVLAQLAAFLDLTVSGLRPYDLPSLVRDFRASLEAELDFRREASNMTRFREAMADEPTVWIPAVIEDFSDRRVLTMERSHGVRLDRAVESGAEPARDLARRIGRLFVRQVFQDGLFHADPHPGNFFVLEDGVICLHDFGMIGELDERMREALVSLLDATVAGDGRAATDAYMDLGLLPRDVDRADLEDQIGALIAEIKRQPLAEVSVGHALGELGRLGGKHRIRNPGSFMLLARAFVTVEGVLARLDPEISFVELFGEALRETLGRRFSPDRVKRDAFVALRAIDRMAREAPDDVRRLLRRWGDGSLGRVTVAPDPQEVERAGRAAHLQRQVLAAGSLAIAGAILAVGAEGTPAVAGTALTVAGSVLLAWRAFVR